MSSGPGEYALGVKMAEDSTESLSLFIKTTKEKIDVEVPADYTVKQVSNVRPRRRHSSHHRAPVAFFHR